MNIKRRMYVGKLLDADNELDAITCRQSIDLVRTAEAYPLDFADGIKPPRDWRLVVAVCGIGVGLAGLFVSLLWTIVTSK